jgi:hypothetical protein
MRIIKIHQRRIPTYVNPDHVVLIIQHPDMPTRLFLTTGEQIHADERADEVVEACNVK